MGFDLRRLAAAAGSDDGLVVSLPAFVDGVPVVRVTAEAFTRRLVQGVGVRLLAMPDTVQIVGANAFLALSVQHIHVGAGVRILGEQPCDLAGVSPRLKRREYSVDARNGRFCARDGNLFADGGSTLLFLASPYDERIELPAGVERIGAAAFAAGCEPPSVVSCPPTLARVDAKGWDDAVWLCPPEALAHRPLAARGVRLAGPRAVELDGCWYDFDDAGAVLVAGPPVPTSVSKRFAAAAAVRAATLRGQSAVEQAPSPGQVVHVAAHSAAPEDALVLPRSVEGRPLVRVGVRALPYAPASLVVADTVRVVERDNACRNAKRLVLPEGLEAIGPHCFCSRILEGPVSIPASVRSIGEGSFEYAVCRLERTGTIVHVSADQLLTCFLTDAEDGVPFDYGRYDELLRSGKNLPDKLGAVLHRLTVPYRLEDATRTALVAYLRDHEREAQKRVAQEGDRAMVEALVRDGFVDERTFDRQIELLRACNRTDCVLYLMEQHRAQSKPTSVRERFAL
ncbi:MAG: leucine-rich repeat protein [Gordonibacter urolithinfaciens]